jgi:hypothetical protein
MMAATINHFRWEMFSATVHDMGLLMFKMTRSSCHEDCAKDTCQNVQGSARNRLALRPPPLPEIVYVLARGRMKDPLF